MFSLKCITIHLVITNKNGPFIIAIMFSFILEFKSKFTNNDTYLAIMFSFILEFKSKFTNNDTLN